MSKMGGSEGGNNRVRGGGEREGDGGRGEREGYLKRRKQRKQLKALSNVRKAKKSTCSLGLDKLQAVTVHPAFKYSIIFGI